MLPGVQLVKGGTCSFTIGDDSNANSHTSQVSPVCKSEQQPEAGKGRTRTKLRVEYMESILLFHCCANTLRIIKPVYPCKLHKPSYS